MELNRLTWTIQDKTLFLNYLLSFHQKEKEEWAREILNTKLNLLCVPTRVIHRMVNDIMKGNYLSFLELEIFDNYESIAIYGMIVSKIRDFDIMVIFLSKYLNVMENWAHCDLLSFTITEESKDKFLLLSHKYVTDQRVFVRRLSLMILFQMVKDHTVLPIIFGTLLNLDKEDAYYVIMMAGWLLSECIICYQKQTLSYLINHDELNRKIVNKGIQKCRESRRLNQEEKDFLLQYKR